MCRELLGRIVDIAPDGIAVAEIDGRPRRVSLAVLEVEGVPVAPGTWVAVHSGLAVRRLDGPPAADPVRPSAVDPVRPATPDPPDTG